MEEFKNFCKKIKWDSIIISILTLIIGVLCVVMPEKSGDVLTIVFGSFLIAMGVAIIIRLFTIDSFFGEHLLLLSILSIDEVKVNISKQTLETMNNIYSKAMSVN